MLNSNQKRKKYKPLIFIIMILFCGCSSSFYKVTNADEYRAELNVTPDRVLLKCEKISDENEFYLFFMYVLDDENTVLAVMQGNNLGIEDCEERISFIGKMKKNGKVIRIGGMNDINKLREIDKKDPYVFPGLGTYYSNGRVLQFMAVMNDKGTCFDAYHGDEKPCPKQGFFGVKDDRN